MFYVTLVTVLVYAVGLGTIFHATAPITEFPKLDPAVVALMGISHAGYLTSNVIIPSSTTLLSTRRAR